MQFGRWPDQTDLGALSLSRARVRLRSVPFRLHCVSLRFVAFVLLPSCQLYSFSLLQHKIYFVLFFAYLSIYLHACLPTCLIAYLTFLFSFSLSLIYLLFFYSREKYHHHHHHHYKLFHYYVIWKKKRKRKRKIMKMIILWLV